MRSRRLVFGSLATAAAIVLSACGGDGSDDGATTDPPAAVDGSTDAAGASDGASSDAEQPSALLPSQLDLVGETVLPESDIESNLLPPVVVDDLSADRKVNVRNLVPRELPVLVWMWAPS